MTRKTRTLARFAKERGRFAHGMAKPKLFEPNRKLELSVSHIDDLDCAEIQEIGIDVVKRDTNARRLYGWAKLTELIVQDIGLSIDYDDIPPRHANILGWPDDQEKRKNLTQILASQASAIRLKSPIDVK